jgi:hypothetical protein
MVAKLMIETNLYEYLERISNLIQSEKHYVSSTTNLTPVQILTLNYLSRCNRFSDTSSALALFLDESVNKLNQSIDSLAESDFLKNKSFGQCQTCAHFTKESDYSFKCGLTQGVLDSNDMVKICQEHA